MSEIKVSCPSCSQHIKCDSAYGGMEISGPTCSAKMTVPSADSSPSPGHGIVGSCVCRDRDGSISPDAAFKACSKLTSVHFDGNAPDSVGVEVFAGSDNVTVYYKQGATGWGQTFCGRPTAVWERSL